jgi:hypothetical protein
LIWGVESNIEHLSELHRLVDQNALATMIVGGEEPTGVSYSCLENIQGLFIRYAKFNVFGGLMQVQFSCPALSLASFASFT